MKLIQQRVLISGGEFPKSRAFRSIQRDILSGLSLMSWPPGAKDFTLNPAPKANGVRPIKSAFMEHLGASGWQLEHRMMLGSRIRPGPVDAVKMVDAGKYFAVEWETGNISSSHRALNKMALGLIDGLLVGGVLMLPSRDMYRYLTDRVGSFAEIEPYFPVWERLGINSGYLAVVEFEPERFSAEVPVFSKGTDGWNMYQHRP